MCGRRACVLVYEDAEHIVLQHTLSCRIERTWIKNLEVKHKAVESHSHNDMTESDWRKQNLLSWAVESTQPVFYVVYARWWCTTLYECCSKKSEEKAKWVKVKQ